jgi:uncharacterized protein
MNERAVFAAEIRVSDDGDGRTVAGIAMPWDEISHGTPHRGGEVFRRGAFKRSLEHHTRAGRLPRLMYAHNGETRPVGLPLKVEESDPGLYVEYRMVNTPAADAALLEVREGVLDALSVGFTAVQAPHNRQGVREVREARLNEVSLVAMPAYENARVLALRGPGSVTDIPERPEISFDPIILGGRAW